MYGVTLPIRGGRRAVVDDVAVEALVEQGDGIGEYTSVILSSGQVLYVDLTLAEAADALGCEVDE